MMLKWTLSLVLALGAADALAFQTAEASIEAVQAFTQGQAAATQKDWATAIPALERAVSLSPEMFVAHYWLGVSYDAQNNAPKALENFQSFLGKAAEDPGLADLAYRATRACGLILAKQRKFAEAAPFLEKTVTTKADDVEARYVLGRVLLSSENKAGAEEQFVRVLEINPKFAPAFLYAGRMAYDRKDDVVARQRLESYIALAPEPAQAAQAHLLLGNLALRTSASERALIHFGKYLEANPTGAQADAVRKNVESLKAGASTTPQTESGNSEAP